MKKTIFFCAIMPFFMLPFTLAMNFHGINVQKEQWNAALQKEKERWNQAFNLVSQHNDLIQHWQNTYPLGYTLSSIIEMKRFIRAKKDYYHHLEPHEFSFFQCRNLKAKRQFHKNATIFDSSLDSCFTYSSGQSASNILFLDGFFEYFAHRIAGYEKPNVLFQIWTEDRKGRLTLIKNYTHKESLEDFRDMYLLSRDDLQYNKRKKNRIKKNGHHTYVLYYDSSVKRAVFHNIQEINYALGRKNVFHVEHHPTDFTKLFPKYLDFIQKYCNIPESFLTSYPYKHIRGSYNYSCTFCSVGNENHDGEEKTKCTLSILFNTLRYHHPKREEPKHHKLSPQMIQDHLAFVQSYAYELSRLSQTPTHISFFIHPYLSSILEHTENNDIRKNPDQDALLFFKTLYKNFHIIAKKEQDKIKIEKKTFFQNIFYKENLVYFLHFRTSSYIKEMWDKHYAKAKPLVPIVLALHTSFPNNHGELYPPKALPFQQRLYPLMCLQFLLPYNKIQIKHLINPCTSKLYYERALRDLSEISPRNDAPPDRSHEHYLFLRLLRVLFDYTAQDLLNQNLNNLPLNHMFFLLGKKYFDVYKTLKTCSMYNIYTQQYERMPERCVNTRPDDPPPYDMHLDLPLIFSQPRHKNDENDYFIARQVPYSLNLNPNTDLNSESDLASSISSDNDIISDSLSLDKIPHNNSKITGSIYFDDYENSRFWYIYPLDFGPKRNKPKYVTQYINSRRVFELPQTKKKYLRKYGWLQEYEKSEPMSSLDAIPQYLERIKELRVNSSYRQEIRLEMLTDFLIK